MQVVGLSPIAFKDAEKGHSAVRLDAVPPDGVHAQKVDLVTPGAISAVRQLSRMEARKGAVAPADELLSLRG